MTVDPPLAVIVSGVLLAGLAIMLVAHRRLFQILRTRYPKVYKGLGSPPLLDPSIPRILAVQWFINRKKDRHLDDPQLTRIADFLRIYTPSYLILVLLGVALVLFS